MTPNSVSAFASAVTHYLNDEQYQAALNRGCAQAKGIYTVESMANRFSVGVMRALGGASANNHRLPDLANHLRTMFKFGQHGAFTGRPMNVSSYSTPTSHAR
jgi:hypothetical protein